ncbi:MAG: molecular chaperone Hsp90 [Clostridiales bacterium]|nr:molecular chaperone Hsp90 [Candidatus Crickella equi]
MANQKTIDKVNKLLAGHCYAPLREAAEAWLKQVGADGEQEATARMIPLLKEGVATVQEMIDLFGSDEGKAKFGEELAGQIYAHAQTLLSQGETYCDCDACKIARGILSDLEG